MNEDELPFEEIEVEYSGEPEGPEDEDDDDGYVEGVDAQ